MRLNTKISFENLYQRAIRDWPDIIDVSSLTWNKDSYQLSKDAQDIVDSIEEKYIGCTDEILIHGLQITIFILVHKIALNCTVVRPSEIRKDVLKSKFEERLHEASNESNLGWTSDDYKLVQEYFEINLKQA